MWLIMQISNIIIAFLFRYKLWQMYSIWNHGFGIKKPSKPNSKLRKKLYIQLVKKPLKLNEKIRKKTKDSIDKKSPKLDKKTKRKIDYLLLCTMFYRGWKTSET